MRIKIPTTCLIAFFLLSGSVFTLSAQAPRRQLRVALYPYVPQKAEMYWKLETEFEDAHKDIDLRFVDLAANYYGGDVVKILKSGSVDLIEVDTVFLPDLAEANLIEEIPGTYLAPSSTFLPVSVSASTIGGRVYGVPHWVCGNFLFVRKDDPEYSRFQKASTLNAIERIFGKPVSRNQGLFVDLHGKSTLGEKYLDAILDEYQTVDEAKLHVSRASPDGNAIKSLNRLFALCPGGLCDSEKHHESDQFYARRFAHREARGLMGYSERMFYIVDEYLNGVREDEPSVGRISFLWNEATNSYDATGTYDVDAISAPLSDKGSKMLAWVDVLALRKGIDPQARKDALLLIEHFNSEKFTSQLLIPSYGNAPRYLLPARTSSYSDKTLLRAAPIYSRFYEIMMQSESVSSKNLNNELRGIGSDIQDAGFNLK